MVSRRNAIFWRMLCAVVTVCLVVTLTPSLSNHFNTGQGANEVYAASAAWDGSYDTSWYNTTDTSFEINTPAQLAGLSALVSGIAVVNGKLDPKTRVAAEDFAGKTITLTADLDMGGVYNESTETWSGPTWVAESNARTVTQSPYYYVTGWTNGSANNYRIRINTESVGGPYLLYQDSTGHWDGPQWWPVGSYPQVSYYDGPAVTDHVYYSNKGSQVATNAALYSGYNPYPDLPDVDYDNGVGDMDSASSITITTISPVANTFNGTFDGNFHSISNIVSLYIPEDELTGDDLEWENGGLFGRIGANAVVKNTIIDSGEFDADNFTGGLVGRSAGTVDTCASYAEVYGGYSNAAGGIVAVVDGDGATVSNCYFGGYVTFEWSSNTGGVGGIVGQNLITARVNNQNVTYSYQFTIENCYSYGEVSTMASSSRLPGSILGRAEGAGNANIVNTYALDNDLYYDTENASGPSATPATLVGWASAANATLDGVSQILPAGWMRTDTFVDRLNAGGNVFINDFYWTKAHPEEGDNDGFPVFLGAWKNWYTYSLKFDAGKGTWNSPASKSQTVTNMLDTYAFDDNPTPPVGYTFDWWYDEKTAPAGSDDWTDRQWDAWGDIHGIDDVGKPVDLEGDTTFYAYYDANEYKVTLDPNGGDLGDEDDVFSVWYDSPYGEDWDDGLPEPELDDEEFYGWFTAKEGGVEVTDDTIVKTTKDHTLYAHWSGPLEAEAYKVKFNSTGGTKITKKITVTEGSKYGKLPTPKRADHVFLGWYTKAPGGTAWKSVKTGTGTKVTAKTKVTIEKNHTLYAHWGCIAYANVAGAKVAGSKGNTIAKLTVGKKLTVLNSGKKYSLVKVGGKTGYVLKSKLYHQKQGVVKGSGTAKVRAAAKAGSKTLGKLKKGKKVTVIGNSGKYYRISYKGKTGYILKKKVKY